ncbi:type II toxin-antitoxin system HigB family toxin [Erwinia sp. 9145]|uniref:type II toxin-antitoxin system HigB family toxin n=1 Tax=Erwinia sp. 9145 TaxID=1500895 RepID=UPI00055090B6|nr:type II toxin-antitoxin system HigB family toxin [Erwinia sp. 9145]
MTLPRFFDHARGEYLVANVLLQIVHGLTPDIKKRYPSADFVGNNKVIFSIKGNDYRLIIAVAYHFKAVYVKFIGTHAENNKIDANTVGT